MNKNKFFVYTFYRFVDIKNKNKIKYQLENGRLEKFIRGTILIADEGLNGSLSATENDLNKAIKFLKKIIKIRKLEIKITHTSFLPFNRMKVRLKKEIVSLGIDHLNINKNRGKFIKPERWNSMILDEEITLLDVRNIFEISIGKFKNSTDPRTKSFRDFPLQLKKLKINKDSKIAMYCTGGIRCEKASSYLITKGYRNVYQLDGGIIKYLEYIKDTKQKSLWSGECFVFDNRVTINKHLKHGKYLQCFGCRHPITKNDTKSKNYLKGVYCPYCKDKRTAKQKRDSLNRQKQIETANLRKINHTFKKYY